MDPSPLGRALPLLDRPRREARLLLPQPPEADLDERRARCSCAAATAAAVARSAWTPLGLRPAPPGAHRPTELPVGPLFCIIDGQTGRRGWSSAAVWRAAAQPCQPRRVSPVRAAPAPPRPRARARSRPVPTTPSGSGARRRARRSTQALPRTRLRAARTRAVTRSASRCDRNAIVLSTWADPTNLIGLVEASCGGSVEYPAGFEPATSGYERGIMPSQSAFRAVRAPVPTAALRGSSRSGPDGGRELASCQHKATAYVAPTSATRV